MITIGSTATFTPKSGRKRAMRRGDLERLLAGVDRERDGSVRVVASDMRSQGRNRELAEERLAELIRRALVVPKRRRPTKPTKASKEARLESKKRHSTKKADRRTKSFD